jgi:hypothetical protein
VCVSAAVRDHRERRAGPPRAAGTGRRHTRETRRHPPPPRRGRPATARAPQPRAAGGRAGPKALVCSNFFEARAQFIHERTRCLCIPGFPHAVALADPSCDGEMGAPVRRCPAPRPGESRAQQPRACARRPGRLRDAGAVPVSPRRVAVPLAVRAGQNPHGASDGASRRCQTLSRHAARRLRRVALSGGFGACACCENARR